MNVGRIGIAGFMGAGKTTCARMVCGAIAGARLVDVDAEAKRLMQGDAAIKRELTEAFGPSVAPATMIDFAALGSIVFDNPRNLRTLNRIVHPPLVRRLREMVLSSGEAPLVVDAALLPLWHIEEWFDVLIWVHTPVELRLDRLKNRLPMTEDLISRRMRLQQGLFEEPKGAPWTLITNHGKPEDLQKQTLSVVTTQWVKRT